MRILYHHRTLADGAEGIHIREMVNAFRELGHEVRLIGPVAPGDSAGHGRAAALKERLPKAAFELASLAYNGRDYGRVRRAIEEFRPDLVYKRHARHDVGALLAARRAGVPSVLEANCVFSARPYADFEPMRLPRLARVLERRALAMATVVVAVSTPLARQVEALAGRTALVVPNGVNTEQFDPAKADGDAIRHRLGLAGAFVVGWSGVIRDWHGLDLLLEATSEVAGAVLLIVGDGPGRPAVEARARALGISSRVVITGRVPHGQMPDYIAAMDVCVVADERTGVASPMKLLEYMAMAKAVVAPRLESIRDVLPPEVEGFLFEAGDRGGLSELLRSLSRDEGIRDNVGQAVRTRILQARTWRGNALAIVRSVSLT